MNLKINNSNKKGFTLIELLVAVSIIGIILALGIFGLQGARVSSRDARRKADLELIRSGLEIYKADCYSYPVALGSSLAGDDGSPSCLSSNVYISAVPGDVIETRSYLYVSDGITYELCAALEGDGSDTCSASCGETCSYRVTNP